MLSASGTAGPNHHRSTHGPGGGDEAAEGQGLMWGECLECLRRQLGGRIWWFLTAENVQVVSPAQFGQVGIGICGVPQHTGFIER